METPALVQPEATEAPLDVIDYYLDMCLASEAPLIFQRWALLTAIGSAMERKCWYKHGDSTIYPNMYTLLVGPSSSRKSSAIRAATRLLEGSGYDKTFQGRTSTEKFMDDLYTGFENIGNDVEGLLDASCDKDRVCNVLVSSSEASEFLGYNDKNMVSLLCELWDNPSHKDVNTKKYGGLRIPNPTVSLLAGTTPHSLNTMLPAELLGQGILSRSILVYCHGSGRKFTYPKTTTGDEREALEAMIVQATSKRGEFKLDATALAAVDDIYMSWKPIRDGRFDSYTGRRLEHLLKLCIIYSAVDMGHYGTDIKYHHVVKANTTLTYTESYMPDALGEYGEALNSKLTNTIMNIIRARKNGIRQEEVLKAAHTDYSSQKDVMLVFMKLRDAGKIDVVQEVGPNGRDIVCFRNTLSHWSGG